MERTEAIKTTINMINEIVALKPQLDILRNEYSIRRQSYSSGTYKSLLLFSATSESGVVTHPILTEEERSKIEKGVEEYTALSNKASYIFARLLQHNLKYFPDPDKEDLQPSSSNFSKMVDEISFIWDSKNPNYLDGLFDVPPTFTDVQINVGTARYILRMDSGIGQHLHIKKTLMVHGKEICPWSEFCSKYASIILA